MAQFKVLVQSFIGNKLVEAGEIVEVNTDLSKGGMKPGSNLEPVKASGAKPTDATDEK